MPGGFTLGFAMHLVRKVKGNKNHEQVILAIIASPECK